MSDNDAEPGIPPEATLATGPSRQDWERTLSGIRDALRQLCAHPLVKADDRAQGILADLVWAQDMVDVDEIVGRLGGRVRQILTERGLRRPRIGSQAGENELSALLAEALGEQTPRRAGRTMLRL